MAITYIKSPWRGVSEAISESTGNMLKMILGMKMKEFETQAQPIKEAMEISPEIAKERYPMDKFQDAWWAYELLHGKIPRQPVPGAQPQVVPNTGLSRLFGRQLREEVPTEPVFPPESPKQMENRMLLGLKPEEREEAIKSKLGLVPSGAQRWSEEQQRKYHLATLTTSAMSHKPTIIEGGKQRSATSKDIQTFYSEMLEGKEPSIQLGPTEEAMKEWEWKVKFAQASQPYHGRNVNQLGPEEQQMLMTAQSLGVPIKISNEGLVEVLPVENLPNPSSVDIGTDAEGNVTKQLYQGGKPVGMPFTPRTRVSEEDKYTPEHITRGVDREAAADFATLIEGNLRAKNESMETIRQTMQSLNDPFTGAISMERVRLGLTPEQRIQFDLIREQAKKIAREKKLDATAAYAEAKKTAKMVRGLGKEQAERKIGEVTNPLKGKGVESFAPGVEKPKPGKAMSPGAAMKKVEEEAKAPLDVVNIQVPKEKEAAVTLRMKQLESGGMKSADILRQIAQELKEGKL